ncbi:hypothetical protein [Streptomyces pactum]|nr:hypothetical protein [Streptomyces pactum]
MPVSLPASIVFADHRPGYGYRVQRAVRALCSSPRTPGASMGGCRI